MIRAHPIPLPQAVFAHGHALQMARLDAKRVTTEMVPLHALARLADEEVMGADFLLQPWVPDCPVSTPLVENIAAPQPAGRGLIDQRPEPILYGYISRTSVALAPNASAPQTPAVVHVAKNPMRIKCGVGGPIASSGAANRREVRIGHADMIPYGTGESTLSFWPYLEDDDDN